MKENKIKQYFASKTPEQVFTFWLFIGCIITMLFCAITRLCGGLWFQADLSKVEMPSQWWQDVIMNLLFIFEMTFVYKILCRTKWFWCLLIASIQATCINFIPNHLAINIINLLLMFIIPFCFHRHWFVLIDTVFLYALTLLYSCLFLVGRIGVVNEECAYNFMFNILGIIDFKLFFVSLYLYIKNFGGVKLWKNQKRLICQRDL